MTGEETQTRGAGERRRHSLAMPAVFGSPGMFLGVKSWLKGVTAWLMAYGALGLFAVALLDSALLPMPSGPDLLMVTLTVLEPEWMWLYALAATTGSTIGCALLYWVARRAGARALRGLSEVRRERIENLLGRYDMLTVMGAAVMPPPFPFKAFVLCAGVLKLRMERFVAGVFIGRAGRFLIEGWLALQFGEDALAIIKRHGLSVLAAVVGILLLIFIVRFLRKRAAVAT